MLRGYEAVRPSTVPDGRGDGPGLAAAGRLPGAAGTRCRGAACGGRGRGVGASRTSRGASGLVYIAERVRRTRRRIVEADARGGRVRQRRGADRGTRRAPGRPARRAARPRRLRRAARPALAGRDLRFPRPGPRDPAAQRGARARPRAAARGARAAGAEAAPGVPVGEVLARSVPSPTSRPDCGERACHRYVISFTRSARDVLDVLEPGGRRRRRRVGLDVVPLFESADALQDARRHRRRAAGGPPLPGAPRVARQAARR